MQLCGILDRDGQFMAGRAASQPLPQSPFDTAICRAFTADPDYWPPKIVPAAADGSSHTGGLVRAPESGGGADLAASLRAGSLRSITRNCLDASVMPAAARGICCTNGSSVPSSCYNSRRSRTSGARPCQSHHFLVPD